MWLSGGAGRLARRVLDKEAPPVTLGAIRRRRSRSRNRRGKPVATHWILTAASVWPGQDIERAAGETTKTGKAVAEACMATVGMAVTMMMTLSTDDGPRAVVLVCG